MWHRIFLIYRFNLLLGYESQASIYWLVQSTFSPYKIDTIILPLIPFTDMEIEAKKFNFCRITILVNDEDRIYIQQFAYTVNASWYLVILICRNETFSNCEIIWEHKDSNDFSFCYMERGYNGSSGKRKLGIKDFSISYINYNNIYKLLLDF